MTTYVNARFLSQRLTGVQRYARELSVRLKQLLPGVRFVCPGNVLQQSLADKLEAVAFGSRAGHFWEQVSLPLWLSRQGGGLLVNLANTAPVFYRPKIVTIHDVAFVVAPQWYSRRFARFYNLIIPRMARRAEHIVTVSEFSKEEIAKYLGIRDNLSVIGNAVASGFGRVSTEGATEHGTYILTLAAGSERKNFAGAVEAFRKVKNSEVRLVAVGDVNPDVCDPKLVETLRTDPRVTLLNSVSDDELRRLYAGARLFFFPSLYEGFGIPPLEAMACGCPCLVSNTTALPEVCGEAAWYCDPRSASEMAAKIDTLLSDENARQELVGRGYERVKRFDWDRSAGQLAELISRCAGD